MKRLLDKWHHSTRPMRAVSLCLVFALVAALGVNVAWAASGTEANTNSTSDSPVFVNDSVPGSLTVSKSVDWSEYDEDAEYEMKVVLNSPDGDTVTGDWSYVSDEKPVYNMKYAVRLYGIEADEDEHGCTLGLTFGPAMGGVTMLPPKKNRVVRPTAFTRIAGPR